MVAQAYRSSEVTIYVCILPEVVDEIITRRTEAAPIFNPFPPCAEYF